MDFEQIIKDFEEEIKSLKEENQRLRALCYFNLPFDGDEDNNQLDCIKCNELEVICRCEDGYEPPTVELRAH